MRKRTLAIALTTAVAIFVVMLAVAAPEFASGSMQGEARLISIQQGQPAACLPDGTPIPDEVIEHVSDVFERACVEFQWQTGDLVAVDNMLVAHARRPYKEPRKMLVAMGEMVSADTLAGAGVS